MTTTPTVWTGPITVNLGATVGAQNFSHAMGLADGTILNAWIDAGTLGAAGDDIASQRFDAEGNRIGGFVILNTISTTDNERIGDIEALPGGGFVVAYIDEQGAGTDVIRLERYDASGGVVFSTFVAAGGTVSFPKLAVATNGNYMLMFARDSAGDQNLRAHVFNGATNVATAEFDAAGNGVDDFSGGEVAALSNGNFVTVTIRDPAAGSNTPEFKITNSSGAQVVAPTQLNVGGLAFDVAGLTGGGFAATWTESPAGTSDIFVRIGTNAGALGAVVTVASGANQQGQSKVVALKDGGFFIVWFDSTDNLLLGQRFNSAGAPIGSNVTIDGVNAPQHEVGLTFDGRILVSYFDGEIEQIVLDPRDNTITGNNTAEVITTRLDSTTVFAGGGNDTILGQGGNDTLQGGAGVDSVYGRAGDDRIEVLEGHQVDNVGGGEGIDTLDLSNITSRAAIVDLAAQTWELSPDFGGPVSISGIEIVNGTQLGDTLIGTAGSQTFNGGAGNDTLRGGADLDVLRGEAGIDTVDWSDATGDILLNLSSGSGTLLNVAGIGTDQFFDMENIIAGSGNDQITGSGVENRIEGRGGDDILRGGAGDVNDTLDGGAGNDTVDYSTLSATVGLALSLLVAGPQDAGDFGFDTLIDIENLKGTSQNDAFDGDDEANILQGLGGNDAFTGGLGNDTFDGGAGIDTVDFSNSPAGVTVNLTIAQPLAVGEGQDFLIGIENLIGSAFNDNFTGQNLVNRFDGGAGNDTLRGGSGNDSLNGEGDRDLLVGDAGEDVIDGGDGIDRLFGGSGNDLLFGGAGPDSLSGGPGIDRLDGGEGADRLFADGTADVFVISTNVGGTDRVFDFVSGLHDIEIDASAFGGAAAGFVFVANGTPAPNNGQQTILFDTDNGKLFFDADGTGATPLVQIGQVIGPGGVVPTLLASDIVLI